jgi:hypothetical protein
MNTFTMSVVVLASTLGQVGADRANLRLAVDLVDGSRVIGAPENHVLRIRTDFAELAVPLERIATATWKADRENVTVRFHNADVLTGGVVPEPLKLQTLFGKVLIEMQHVASLETLPPEAKVAPPVGQDLMLYYPFDVNAENGAIANVVQDKHHGKLFGATWTEEGRRGGAYRFAGSGDRIETPDDPALRLQQLTLCAWVYPEDSDYSTWRGIITKTTSGSWSNGFGLARYHGTPKVHFFVNYYSGATASHEIPDHEWSHVAASYDGKMMVLYINGKRVAETSNATYGPAITHGEQPLEIGSAPNGYQWIGKIDEVMIFCRALSDREIQRIYELTQ